MRNMTICIMLLAVFMGFQMAYSGTGRRTYDYSPMTASEFTDPVIDTNAIIDDAVTAAKIAAGAILDAHIADSNISPEKFADGNNVGDMLWWDNTVWRWFDANEPNNILRLTDTNSPEWSTEGVTTENNITNNIINNLKLKKTGAFSDNDILTVDTSGSTFTGNTLAAITAGQAMSARPAGFERYWIFNMADPLTLQAADTEWSLDPNTAAALTISKVEITLDADPTTEFNLDLKFADAFIGLGSATLIGAIDTTAGVANITSFSDATVPANKCVYLSWGAAPDALTLQGNVKIYYTFDQP